MNGRRGLAASDIGTIAAEAVAALDSGQQIASFSARRPDFDLEDAYRVTAAVRRLREGRGERPVGRKIGFTNRAMWAAHGVHAPIWGYVYDRTSGDLATSGGAISLARLAEPRIEPEIVFGLAAAPAPDMDEAALRGCIDWVAAGFEIVQSIFPGWRFSAPDTVAAFGLHGALLIGPRHAMAPQSADWHRRLSTFAIELSRNGVVIDRGHGSNALGGPVAALRHLVGLLADDPFNPPLAAGEIVTTGTLTLAHPVARGETWIASPSGIGLPPIAIRFA